VSDRVNLVRRVARLRVPLGFFCGALVLWLATPTLATLSAGTAVAVLGEAIRIWAAGHLNKAREVTSSGPYRWVAHPLYVGSSVIAAGLAIACHSAIVATVIAIYMIATIAAAVKDEEAFLRSRFGNRYDRYRRDGLIDPRRRFSFALAMTNREQRAVVGLALAVLLLAWKATYNDTFWRTAGTRFIRPGG
jgi:type IV secretory pathway TraG/TraD family ATPase VirD4